MRESARQTHTLTLTHSLTHGANRRCRNGLALVRESVSLISHPICEGRNVIARVCERVCVPASARVYARVYACAYVKGLKQTHMTHRLTRCQAPSLPRLPHPLAHVASFGVDASVVATRDSIAQVATGAEVPEWQASYPILTPAIGSWWIRRRRCTSGQFTRSIIHPSRFRSKAM